MNYLDIMIAVPLLYGLIKGIKHGLIKEITGFVAILMGVYVSIHFSELLTPYFKEVLKGNESFIPILSFALLFVVILLLIKFFGYLADKFMKALALGIINYILGGLFGALKMAIAVSFVIYISDQINIIPKETKQTAVLYHPTTEIIHFIAPHLDKNHDVFDKLEEETEKVKKMIEKKINLK